MLEKCLCLAMFDNVHPPHTCAPGRSLEALCTTTKAIIAYRKKLDTLQRGLLYSVSSHANQFFYLPHIYPRQQESVPTSQPATMPA